jgi:hypothetical protein
MIQINAADRLPKKLAYGTAFHHLADIARQLNPLLRGWIEYYGRFTRAALGPIRSGCNRDLRSQRGCTRLHRVFHFGRTMKAGVRQG